MRLIVSMIAGIAVAGALFLFMQYAIQTEGTRPDIQRGERIDFVRVDRDDAVRERERQRPEPPPEPTEPPPPERMQVETQQVRPDFRPQIAPMDFPAMGVPMAHFTGASMYQPRTGDGDVTPLVVVEPQWPREALLNGIEGWVEVRFTIGPDGRVSNARVVASEPRRTFDRSALRAIERWRFRPRVVDGRPVEREATQIIEFRLDDRGRTVDQPA